MSENSVNMFVRCAWFYYQLARCLGLTNLMYNKPKQRMEFQTSAKSWVRRLMHFVLLVGLIVFAIYAIVFVVIMIVTYGETAGDQTPIQLVSFFYGMLLFLCRIGICFTILYRFKRRKTNRFLRQFFNKLIEMQQRVPVLTGQSATVPWHIKCLLLLKLLFIIMTTELDEMGNFFGYRIYELTYFGNYLICLRLLKFQKALTEFINRSEAKYEYETECAADCKDKKDALFNAIDMLSQTEQMFASYVTHFGWFEKLILLENIFCVYLTNQFIACVILDHYFSLPLLADISDYMLNMLLLAQLNDAVQGAAKDLSDAMTAIIAKLTQQRRLCAHCGEFLEVIDVYICGRSTTSMGIQIFEGLFWSRSYAFDVLHGLALVGVSLTQFDTEQSIECKYQW